MAESDKTEHISESIMERFSVRNLSESELTNVARHVTRCPDCQAEFVSSLRRQRGDADLSFTLAPEFWLRNEHLDYEQLVELGDDKLDAADRELIDAHLKVCALCREDVQSLLAFREQIAPEMRVSYAPVEKELAQERLSWVSWWRGMAWKPVYSAALVVIGVALLIGAAILLNRDGENQQAQQSPTPQMSPGSTPDGRASHLPSLTESPSEKLHNTEAVVVLNDRGRTIKVDRSGNVTGLNDISAPMRDEIAKVVLTETIESPAILKEFGGQDVTLRGSNKNAQPLKLIFPSRTVIVSNRPALKWEKAAGATSYKVYVNDQAGSAVANSEELPPVSTHWVPPKPLKRGQIYTWTVVATIDGKEMVSPGPSMPEVKFQVLSADNMRQLNQLKKTRSHLALGIFFARRGMIAEAEHEFRILARNNARSESAIKLLRLIQSWQRQ